MMKNLNELNVTGKVITTDILVCGLGPAGLTAAIRAGRQGVRVTAVEQYPFAGGNITNAGVIGICGAFDMHTGRLIVGGLSRDLIFSTAYKRDLSYSKVRRPLWLREAGSTINYDTMTLEQLSSNANAVQYFYDMERLKLVADRMLAESGVQTLYHTKVCAVDVKETVANSKSASDCDDSRVITEVYIANKDGLSVIRPRIVIDCTGDADIAAWSGAPFDLSRDMQAATLMFTMGNVNYGDFQVFVDDFIKMVEDAHATGEIGQYAGPSRGVVWPGVVNFNMTRLPFNAASASELSKMEMQGRADIDNMITVFKRRLPEYFADAYLIFSGPATGARESRRIVGEYVLNLEDLLNNNQFDDTIALGAHFVDFHDPKLSGFQTGRIPYQMLRPYGVPYRSLLPQKVDNLLVAGRCHSVSQEALASTRVTPTAMLMGEAAGLAAATAIKSDSIPRDVDTAKLRAELLAGGSILS